MPEVFIENIEVSPALKPKSPEDMLNAGAEVIQKALQGDEEISAVYGASQTFHEYGSQEYLQDLVAKSGLSPKAMIQEQVYSNSQPVLHEIFDRVQRNRERILVIGIEALGLLPKEERPKIIGKGLGPDLKDVGTMANAIGFLSAVWARQLGIQVEDLKARMMEVALRNYGRASLVPHSQFFGKKAPTPEEYQANYGTWIDASGMLTKYDCAPGDSNQVAAMVIGPDESKAKARVMGWKTAEDTRPFKARLGFENKENEAVHQAFTSALKNAGLTREELMINGMIEVHNAFSPLIYMTLHEMGYLRIEDMGKPWGQMNNIDPSRINPNGGLKTGHPLAVTAMARFFEVLKQFAGTAPAEAQLGSLRYGVVQSVAGARHKISVTVVGGY
jgi:acetyl-CoA acetyltransferase